MYSIQERPATEREREFVASMHKPESLGCVLNTGLVCLASLIIGIVGTLPLSRATGWDTGTAGAGLMIGTIVVLGVLLSVPPTSSLPMRLWYAFRPAPTLEAVTEIVCTADWAWSFAGSDEDAPAVLLRVDADRYLALNDQRLYGNDPDVDGVVDPDETRARREVRVVWWEPRNIILALDGSGENLPLQPIDVESDWLLRLWPVAVVHRDAIPPDVFDAMEGALAAREEEE